MLYLVTGVPGASKTAFVVTELDKIESNNKINLLKNISFFEHNKKMFEQYKEDFSYYITEVGSGHQLKQKMEVLDDDYFNMLGEDFDHLRPDDYYLRATRYNEIIERIQERDGDKGFKFMLPVRTIYSNIKALKIDYVRANEYDWRDCPDGSIIVIDEVQLVEPYSDLKNKSNDIVQELTIHRHRGFDFYFITQSPSLLHPTIKELIACHYHITRPYGLAPKVYRFGSCRAYPNTLINKLNCEDKFTFKPQDRIFKLYKSTSINTHKGRIPKGVFFFLFLSLFFISIFIYIVSTNGMGVVGTFIGIENTQQVSKDIKPSNTNNKNVETSNVDKKDDAKNDVSTVSVKQDTDNEQIKNETQKPRIVGCMQMENTCNCYHEHGGIIDLTQNECKRYLAGYKPYYDNRNYDMQQQSVPVSNNVYHVAKTDEKDEKYQGNQIVGTVNNDTFFDTDDNQMSYLTSEK